MLLKKIPNISLIIIGEGPTKKHIGELIKYLRIEEKVLLPGFISNKDLPFYYRICDLFVLPSIEEAQGIVLLEAMASGVPIVAMNQGGVPEVVNSDFGILVEENNSYKLFEAMYNILTDDICSRKKMKILARKTAVDKYSWKNIAITTKKIYNTISS